MAKTVDEGFSTFLSWLTPTKTESANAKSHRASIEACIKSNFGLNRFFRTGSFGNGTSVSNYSDVDYFASIPREKLKADSNLTLQELKKALDTRFPNTGVRIDGPAVVVPFGSDISETTEVVPADYLRQEVGENLYHIPDGNGGWMYSSPGLHKYYVDHYDKNLSNKVKPLIRFVKAWKFYQSVPISSFYLEMFTAIYASTEKSIVYDIDLLAIFQKLKNSDFASFNDPYGITGTIRPFKYTFERTKAQEKIADAVRRAGHARKVQTEGRVEDALKWWNTVYDDMFPGYY
jgi:hypothetical protein